MDLFHFHSTMSDHYYCCCCCCCHCCCCCWFALFLSHQRPDQPIRQPLDISAFNSAKIFQREMNGPRWRKGRIEICFAHSITKHGCQVGHLTARFGYKWVVWDKRFVVHKKIIIDVLKVLLGLVCFKSQAGCFSWLATLPLSHSCPLSLTHIYEYIPILPHQKKKKNH